MRAWRGYLKRLTICIKSRLRWSESNQDTIRRDMEKLKTGKSLYVDIAREEEVSSGEARERDVMTQLLEMLNGQRSEDPVKRKYPTPLKNGNYLLNSGDERQMQKIFDF